MLPLALVLAAAPVLPEGSFPKPVKAPVELIRPKDATPLAPAAAETLAKQLAAFRPSMKVLVDATGPTLSQTHASLAGGGEDLDKIVFTPFARVTAGGCTIWALEWRHQYSEAESVSHVVVTTRSDHSVADAAELDGGGGGLYIGLYETTTRIEANGSIGVRDLHTFWHADLPIGPWTDEVTDETYEELALQPDCTLRRAPLVHRTLSGHVADPKTNEELWISDDGKKVKAIYSARQDGWTELLVDQPDRKAGTLVVRFPKSKQPYPLKWNAEHTQLTCLQADGGTQLFEEARF